ncbi:hypothetical protein MMC07_009772, partial [Pseudocyphellaria aurata]|nr:hypothetical protein [Pseudocyphellaria aurata]
MREHLPPVLVGFTSQTKQEHSPWRLWRGLVPQQSQEKNLVVLGMTANVQAAIKNHIVEIWAVAYITGKLNSPRNLSLIATPPISLGWNEALVTTNRASREKDGCPITEV